jgi:hypothetical protein
MFLILVGGAKNGYYMNLESAQRGYRRSTLVEQRGQAPNRASDYMNIQCPCQAQRYMLCLWTLAMHNCDLTPRIANRALRRMRPIVVLVASRLAPTNVTLRAS